MNCEPVVQACEDSLVQGPGIGEWEQKGMKLRASKRVGSGNKALRGIPGGEAFRLRSEASAMVGLGKWRPGRSPGEPQDTGLVGVSGRLPSQVQRTWRFSGGAPRSAGTTWASATGPALPRREPLPSWGASSAVMGAGS